MANSLASFATCVTYGASQLPRVAWYVGHNAAMRRLSEAARQRAAVLQFQKRKRKTSGAVDLARALSLWNALECSRLWIMICWMVLTFKFLGLAEFLGDRMN
jgi:hypothetical protein